MTIKDYTLYIHKPIRLQTNKEYIGNTPPSTVREPAFFEEARVSTSFTCLYFANKSEKKGLEANED